MEVNQPAPQAPAAPTAPTPQTPAAEAPKQVSPQFEALARKETAIRKQREELDRLKQELEGKRKQYETYEQKRSRAKENPLEAMQELGLTYEQLTQYILNDKKPTPDMEVASAKDEIAKLREEFETRQKQEREQQEQWAKQQQEQQVAQFKADLADYIAEKASDFEHLAGEGDDGVELVHELMSADWQNKLKAYEEGGRVGRPPKIMSTEEACKLVESHYDEKFDKAFERSKKLQGRYAKAQAEAQSDPNVLNPPSGLAPAQLAKTLNNGLIQPSAPSSLPPKNERERIERALRALG